MAKYLWSATYYSSLSAKSYMWDTEPHITERATKLKKPNPAALKRMTLHEYVKDIYFAI